MRTIEEQGPMTIEQRCRAVFTAIVDDRLEGLKTGRGQLKDFNSLVNLLQWLGTPVSREKHGKCSAHASHPLHPHLQMEVLDVMEYF